MAQNFHIAHRQVGVSNVQGLNLRVADKIVKLANAFQSDVTICCKGIIANGKSILGLLGLAAECGTMLAVEAQGCDAEDAVAALANLISALSHGTEDQNAEAGVVQPESKADAGPPKEDHSTESPLSQWNVRSLKSGARWDSSRRGSTGPGIDRRNANRGRWARR
jgi:phosphocarrier protein HPr